MFDKGAYRFRKNTFIYQVDILYIYCSEIQYRLLDDILHYYMAFFASHISPRSLNMSPRTDIL